MVEIRSDGTIPEEQCQAVRRLLWAADEEFIPPLSARGSTTQTALGAAAASPEGPVEYFASLLGQRLLIASEEGAVLGFMSFRPGCASIDAFPVPVHYVTTVITAPEARGRGVASALYDEVLRIAAAAGEPVATRTWSGNDAHLRLLERKGFALARRIEDDRGPGIDTVYLMTAQPSARSAS